MNDELQLGKYEFFPYDEEREKILRELEQSELTEEKQKSLEDMLEELLKRKKKKEKR